MAAIGRGGNPRPPTEAVPLSSPPGQWTPAPSEQLAEWRPLRLIVGSTFACDGLAAPLHAWAADVVGVPIECRWLGYGTLLAALCSGTSVVNRDAEGALRLVFARLEDMGAAHPEATPCAEAADVPTILSRAAEDLCEALTMACALCTAGVILIMAPPSPEAFDAEEAALGELYARIQDSSLLSRRVHVVPMADTLAACEAAAPGGAWHSPFLQRVAHSPFSARALSAIAMMALRQALRTVQPPRKALAVDCDWTLWRGAAGECATDPTADAFLAVQRMCVTMHSRGVAVCLVSRNRLDDVHGVFAAHGGRMALSLAEHVSAVEASQSGSKADAVKRLAEMLSLPVDSFLFVDDSPMEVADVRGACPGVAAALVPRVEALLPTWLMSHWALDSPLSLSAAAAGARAHTREDVGRTKLYQQLVQRRRFQTASASADAFLASLNLTVAVEAIDAVADDARWDRAAQLTDRTNQHHARKVPRSSDALRALCAGADSPLVALDVKSSDRFGDHGTVGLILRGRLPVELPRGAWRKAGDGGPVGDGPGEARAVWVATWLLSCRVLHIGVEFTMLRHVCEEAEALGAAWLLFDYEQTERNEPAAAFLFSLPEARYLETDLPPALDWEGTSAEEPAGEDEAEPLTTADAVEQRLSTIVDNWPRPSTWPSSEELHLLPDRRRRQLAALLARRRGTANQTSAGPALAPLALHLRARLVPGPCRDALAGRPCAYEDCPFDHAIRPRSLHAGTPRSDKRGRPPQGPVRQNGAPVPATCPAAEHFNRPDRGVSVYRISGPRPAAARVAVRVDRALAAARAVRGPGAGDLARPAPACLRAPAAASPDGRRVPYFHGPAHPWPHDEALDAVAMGLATDAQAVHGWVADRAAAGARPRGVHVACTSALATAAGLESSEPLADEEAAAGAHARLRRQIRHGLAEMVKEENKAATYYSRIEHSYS